MPLTVYKSSAGSGKTYTLVREYIKLLVKEPNHFRNILAITFTNKATNEMKQRLVTALARLADGDFPDLEGQLLDELAGEDPKLPKEPARARQYVRRQSATALDNILHHYSEFAISTIDSFFQRILRNFSKELKLPVHYELEMNRHYVLDSIVAHLLLDIGHEKSLTRWLEEFAYHRMDENKGWKIEQSIKNLGEELFREAVWQLLNESEEEMKAEAARQNPEGEGGDPGGQAPAQSGQPASLEDELEMRRRQDAEMRKLRYGKLKKIIGQLWGIVRSFDAKMQGYAQEALDLIKGYGLTTQDLHSYMKGFFPGIIDGNYKPIKESKTVPKIYEGDTDAWTTKNSPNREKIKQVVENGLQQVFVELVDFYNGSYIDYASAREVLKNLHVYGLLNDLKYKLRDYRTDNNLLLISDTNNLLRSIVTEDAAPFIYEKTGQAYRHILIDEFQDTSDFQWHNLLPLVANSLGGGNAALVVGDAKQSIYRWRGGNMQLLMHGVQRDLPLFYTAQTEKRLAVNYRSKRNIVLFNNAFFRFAAKLLSEAVDVPGAEEIAVAYSGVEQQLMHGQGGLVQIAAVEDADCGWKHAARENLLETIGQLQGEGFALRDLAILVRRNDEGSELAGFLAGKRIKVASSESLLLTQSVKVRLLLAAMRYINDARNSIARTEMLFNYLLVRKNRGDGEAARLLEPSSLHKVYADHALRPDDPESLFASQLPEAFFAGAGQRNLLPPYEMAEQLIEVFGLNKPPDAYIQRFQDVLLERGAGKNTDLRGFLEWWVKHGAANKSTSVIVPEGENAITIMTIHKAKGLEFPVVLMPYADWDLKPRANSIVWSQSQQPPYGQMGPLPLGLSSKLAETHFADDYNKEVLHSYLDNLNLLYVAFTRPTQRLYVTLPQSWSGNFLGRSGKLVLQVLEGFDLSGSYDASEMRYRLPDGEKTPPPEPAGNPSAGVLHIGEYPCRNYQSKLSIKTDKRQKLRFATLNDTEMARPIKRGIQIHAVLEKMRHPGDLENTLLKLQAAGLAKPGELPELRQRVQSVLDNETVKGWFAAGYETLNERPIINGSSVHIPDKVLLNGTQAVIIDYKTLQPGTDLEAQQGKHRKQVERYAAILKQMGYTVEKKCLLYIGEEITPVEW